MAEAGRPRGRRRGRPSAGGMSGRTNGLLAAAAARAVEAADHDVSLAYIDCRSQGNTLIWLFLRCAPRCLHGLEEGRVASAAR